MITGAELLKYLIDMSENSIQCINEELKKLDDSDYSYEKKKIKEGRLIQLHFYLDIFNNLNDDSYLKGLTKE